MSRFVPDEEQIVWFVNGKAELQWIPFNPNHPKHKKRLAYGNIFRCKQDAEFALSKLRESLKEIHRLLEESYILA